MADEEKKVTSIIWTASNIKQIFKGKQDSLKSPEFSRGITLSKPKTLEKIWVLKWNVLLKKIIETEESESGQHPHKKRRKHRRRNRSSEKLSDESVKRQYLGFYLQNSNDELPPMPILKVTFSIVKPATGKIYSKTKELFKIVKGQDFGVSDFISLEELDSLNLYDLMILCEFEEIKQDIESFKPLLNNTMLSDIELNVGGNFYPAHKMVLALSSSYFREKIASHDSLRGLKMRDTESKFFEKLLIFMYTGKVNNIESEGLDRLIEVFRKFRVWDFFTDYEINKTLKARLNIENVIPIISVLYRSVRHNFEEVRSLYVDCINFTVDNLTSILDLDIFKNFVKINPDLIRVILAGLDARLVISECRKKVNAASLRQSNIERCSYWEKFETFLNNKIHSDIDFQIGDEKYHAHRLILRIRSPVFDRMFSHNMTETITGVVKINDVKPEVFYQVLRFIYTNEFETKDNDLVLKILIVADKYDIDDLKLECENILANSLTIENFQRTITFADDLKLERLKKMCIVYFIDNMFLKEYGDKQNRKDHFICTTQFAASDRHLLPELLNRLVFDYELVFKK